MINPSDIMAIVATMVILSVGIFVFFTVFAEINEMSNESEEAMNKIIENTNPILNLLPVMIVVGAIMAIVGMVFNISRPSFRSPPSPPIPIPVLEIPEKRRPVNKYPHVPENIGDYRLHKITGVDEALETAKILRDGKYWSKIVMYKDKKYKLLPDRNCAVYVSMWTKDESADKGKPKWSDT